jgi:hypothetical protein
MTTCQHIVGTGRPGEKGTWCLACGVKILEVHDRPCRECRHSQELLDGWICSPKLMAITPDMLVTYWLVSGSGRYGLCFEDRETHPVSPGDPIIRTCR